MCVFVWARAKQTQQSNFPILLRHRVEPCRACGGKVKHSSLAFVPANNAHDGVSDFSRPSLFPAQSAVAPNLYLMHTLRADAGSTVPRGHPFTRTQLLFTLIFLSLMIFSSPLYQPNRPILVEATAEFQWPWGMFAPAHTTSNPLTVLCLSLPEPKR